MEPQANTGSYTLRATVSSDTVAFAERPTRTALTVLTQDFVDSFEDLFETSKPNGAITFVSEDTASAVVSASSLDVPLIAVLSQPKIVDTSVDDSTVVIEYTMMTQSKSQSGVISIEQFLNNTFGSCSIFLDGTAVYGALV